MPWTEALGGASEIATSPLDDLRSGAGACAQPQAFLEDAEVRRHGVLASGARIVVQPDPAGNRPCRARGLRLATAREEDIRRGSTSVTVSSTLRPRPAALRSSTRATISRRPTSRARPERPPLPVRPNLTGGLALSISRDRTVRRQSTPRRRPLKGIAFHESRDRRVARQGEDHQQISGQGLRRLRLVRPCEGSRGEGRLGRPGRRFRHALGGRCEGRQAAQRHRRGGQKCRPSHPGDRPGPGRRGHLLAHPRDPEEQEAAQGQARRSCCVQCCDQGRSPGGDAQSARDRRGPRRRLPGAPRARLPSRLQPLAGPVAKAARRTLGRARAVGGVAHRLRPGA